MCNELRRVCCHIGSLSPSDLRRKKTNFSFFYIYTSTEMCLLRRTLTKSYFRVYITAKFAITNSRCQKYIGLISPAILFEQPRDTTTVTGTAEIAPFIAVTFQATTGCSPLRATIFSGCYKTVWDL
jgi:hypothetical protein